MTKIDDEEIHITISGKDVDDWGASVAMLSELGRPLGIVFQSSFLILTACLTIIFMQIYLGKIELNHDFYKYIVIISIISFILYVLSGSLRKSLIASVMRRYRMSRPDPRITIDSDSFRVESGSSVATIGWDAFEGILKRKDRILLLVSPMSAYPIPFRSLPDGVKPEELTRRIEGYMAAATKKV